MIRTMRTFLLPAILFGLLALLACGSDDERAFSQYDVAEGAAGALETVVREVVVEKEVMKEVIREVPVEIAREMRIAEEAPVPQSRAASDGAGFAVTSGTGENASTEEAAALVSQQRIIVRTVDMDLLVLDVEAALDTIADMAQEMEGWVVSSDRSRKHSGFISFRVPATQLDDARLRLRKLADEVESEVSRSKDVTDEYVDTTARLKNFQATEEALIKLLAKAEKVEDALKVQAELTRIQGDLESMKGRVKFLEQTSAFSLLNVSLRLVPIEMLPDAGSDQTFSVGQVARFRASFKPPEDIEDFEYTWDFGDGSPAVSGHRTAPTLDEDTRMTATVTHVYNDDRDAPFIAEIEIKGLGDSGVAEGKDTLIVAVTKLPSIQVFAGESRVVKQGEEAEYSGTFTRPAELTDVTFKWDFGDGTPPVTGSMPEGVTKATASHAYADHRPFAYNATLTVTAQSDAGEVEATSSFSVLVTESPNWTVSGWSAGDTWKSAVRALSGVGQGLGTLFIWLAIFSPAWLVATAIGLILVRRIRRRPSSGGPGTSDG